MFQSRFLPFVHSYFLVSIFLMTFLFPVIFYPCTFSFPLLSLFLLFLFFISCLTSFSFLFPYSFSAHFLPCLFYVIYSLSITSFHTPLLSFVSTGLYLTSFLSWASSIFFSFFLSFFPCFVCSCPVIFPLLNLTFLYFMSCPVLSLVLFSPVLYFPSWPYSSRTLIVLIAATSDHVSSKCLPQSTCVWMQCTVKKTSRTNTPPIWNAGLD